jgi:hypothetical protein
MLSQRLEEEEKTPRRGRRRRGRSNTRPTFEIFQMQHLRHTSEDR